MPINNITITNSYADNKNLRLPLTQLIDNQRPLESEPSANSMGAVLLRIIAFLLFLSCTSPNNRQQIWTPTNQDQQIPSLRIPLYTSTRPFPAIIANSHKTINAEEIIFRPHYLPILFDLSNMNTSSYALAVLGASKTGRKASEISESPVRPSLADTDDWPAIAVETTPGNQSERSQGNAKKGKLAASVGSQRKLNAFFARANAGSNKTSIPPPRRAVLPGGNAGLVSTAMTPPSPSTTKGTTGVASTVVAPPVAPTSPPTPMRLLPSAIRGTSVHEGTPPSPPSVTVLTPLGLLRSKATKEANPLAPSLAATGKKADPPTRPTLPPVVDSTLDDDEMETEMTPVKVYPKSVKSKKATSSGKRKSARGSVGFTAPDPNHVQLVEPEDAIPTPKVDHPYKTVLSTSVRLEKAKDPLSLFIGKMVDALAFLRTHVDPTIAILPKSPDFDNEHIVDKPSFPTVVFTLNQRYFNIETRGAFADNTKTQNGKTVKLSLILGSTIPITHQLLDEVRHDTSSVGVTFWYKPHQEVDTVTRIVFLGAPNNANKVEAKEIIDNALRPLEQHLRTTDPKSYPPEVFGLPWPDFAVVSEQPTGQPFIQPEVGKDGKPVHKIYVPPPSERRSLHIMCKKSDYSRLASLVTVAKARNMWLKEFGMCYPVESPDYSYSKTQCNDYLKMVDVHESAQLSYGTFRISGLIDPGVPSTLRRETGDPITVSVRQIMRMITTPREIVQGKVLPGQPVWLCVLLSDNGSYTGYYAGANSKHQKFASAFAKCPAAQIRYFLIRHGIMQHDVNKFIRNNFSMAQIRLIGQAKWNSRAGLAVVPVQPGEENILDAARVDSSLVDLSKLTKRDFEEDEPVVGEYNGPSSSDPACYQFDSAQSVTTIQHNTDKLKASSAGKSVATMNMGASVFTLDDDNEDEDDAGVGALAATSDPLQTLRNEEMQFDLAFLKSQQRYNNNGEESMDTSSQSHDKDTQSEDKDTPVNEQAPPSSTSKALESQFDDATSDACLAAAAIGLEIESVAQDEILDEDCFAIVLAGIESERSFGEMFEILESLIEEAEETDNVVLRGLRERNTHVPERLRELIIDEARESEESVIDHLNKLHGWLRESEVEDADEKAASVRYHERQNVQNGTFQPRPEDFGNEKPQGCEHREKMPSTNASAQSASATDDLTSRLGAHAK